MSMELGWNDTDRGKTGILGGKFIPLQFVKHKPHMDWPGNLARAFAVQRRKKSGRFHLKVQRSVCLLPNARICLAGSTPASRPRAPASCAAI